MLGQRCSRGAGRSSWRARPAAGPAAPARGRRGPAAARAVAVDRALRALVDDRRRASARGRPRRRPRSRSQPLAAESTSVSGQESAWPPASGGRRKSRSSSPRRSGHSSWGQWPQSSITSSREPAHGVEHPLGAGLEHQQVLAAPDQQHRAVDPLELERVVAARAAAAGPWRSSRAAVARSAKWPAKASATRGSTAPGGGRRAGCRPRRPPAAGPRWAAAAARRAGRAAAGRARRARTSAPCRAPRGPPARSPGRGRARSASRSATQPPSELPHHDRAALGRELLERGVGEARRAAARIGVVGQLVGGAEARQVERQRAPAARAPSRSSSSRQVSALSAKPCKQQQRRPLALQLERAGLVPRELQPVLEQRLHGPGTPADVYVEFRAAPGRVRGAARARRPARRSGSATCSSESRSRSVTVSSSIVWWSTVTPQGVPISSWRR